MLVIKNTVNESVELLESMVNTFTNYCFLNQVYGSTVLNSDLFIIMLSDKIYHLTKKLIEKQYPCNLSFLDFYVDAIENYSIKNDYIDKFISLFR
jgi:hypothetical protein